MYYHAFVEPKDLVGSVDPPNTSAETNGYLHQKAGYLYIKQLSVAVKAEDLIRSVDPPSVKSTWAREDLYERAGYLLEQSSIPVESEDLIRSIDPPAVGDLHEKAGDPFK